MFHSNYPAMAPTVRVGVLMVLGNELMRHCTLLEANLREGVIVLMPLDEGRPISLDHELLRV
jgi:hypothetical protein